MRGRVGLRSGALARVLIRCTARSIILPSRRAAEPPSNPSNPSPPSIPSPVPPTTSLHPRPVCRPHQFGPRL
ncbi:hypothetical protein T210_0124480 [Burkholderia pseudomallei MSHR6137]|nr:hypothetical protein T210_0124480 [Burkholderia pseudomallei MSHR6137]